MKKNNGWVIVIAGVVALLFLFGGSMLGGWGNRGVGIMNGPGMMRNLGYSPVGGGIFGWLIPVGFVMLATFGLVWLVRNISKPTRPPSTRIRCPGCGEDAQADWNNCPNCGTTLKQKTQ